MPNEPIAIVGMACRFPGRSRRSARVLGIAPRGVDAITEVPEGSWNAARFYHPTSARRAGWSRDGADSWRMRTRSTPHFSASRRAKRRAWTRNTAGCWRPAWEAIEDAGLPPEKLAGSRTGVFVGISHSDYPTLQRRDASSIDRYTNIGSALSIAANRLSYLLDLRGPSLAVDTACSSSLVALHLAARSLWSGECDHALVGGANAVLTPEGEHRLQPGAHALAARALPRFRRRRGRLRALGRGRGARADAAANRAEPGAPRPRAAGRDGVESGRPFDRRPHRAEPGRAGGDDPRGVAKRGRCRRAMSFTWRRTARARRSAIRSKRARWPAVLSRRTRDRRARC